MRKGILGRKMGMTQVFTTSGKLIPVTVVSVEPNIVTQIKTEANDGYDAIQLGYDTKREKLATKASLGHTTKAGTTPKRFFREVRNVNVADYNLGQEVDANVFEIGEMVDVTGVSKGKGFQGVIKRHNQSRGPMSHGSRYHRRVGSMGPMQPMRVMKGKNLPGHMGSLTVTVQNLEIIKIDLEENVILVKGNIPGARKSLVFIKSAVKNPDVVNNNEELINYLVEDAIYNETESVDIDLVSEDAVVESAPEISEAVEASEVKETKEKKEEKEN